MKRLVLPLLLLSVFLFAGCGKEFQKNEIVDCEDSYVNDFGLARSECGDRQVIGIHKKYVAIAPVQIDCGNFKKAVSILKKSDCKRIKPVFREREWIDSGYVEYKNRLQTTPL